MPAQERAFTGFQLRRMGFPLESRYCIVKRLPIGNFYIGRKLNPEWDFLNLPSTYTSKHHCRIECRENGQMFLHDTSTNGTFVNDENILNRTVDLRDKDRIGVGFPVNENIAHNGKSFYGFILERVVVKKELKEEPCDSNLDDDEANLVIDESPAPLVAHTPENLVQIPEIEVPPVPVAVDADVIAQVDDLEWNPDMNVKEEFVKHELEDDMGGFTDEDDDDVIFVDPDAPVVTKTTTESFNYLNQLSQAAFTPFDDDGYNNTQMLLNDLMERSPVQPPKPVTVISEPQSPSQVPASLTELPTPIPPNTLEINAVTSDNLSTSNITPETPAVNENTANVITDPKPSTSKASANDSNELLSVALNPVNPVEMLKTIDLDTLLSSLAEIYDIDVVISKLKAIKGEVIMDSDDSHTDKKKEKNNGKSDKRSSKHRHLKKKSKEKSPRALNDDPTFLKEKSPPKLVKRRESYKDRRNSIDKLTTSKEVKVASVEKRRKSVYDHPGPSAEYEPVINGDRSLVPEPIIPRNRRISTEVNSKSEHRNGDPPTTGLKRKAEELVTSPEPAPLEKRRHKFDLNDSIKKLRPVPQPKNIEDTFTPSQLPPPLDVVPEAKEPVFNHKIFNKKKERVAHNKVSENDEPKRKDDEGKSKNKEREKKWESNRDPRKKRGDDFRIPKIITRRQSSTEDMQLFLDRLDEATKDDSGSEKQNDVRKENYHSGVKSSIVQVPLAKDVQVMVTPPVSQSFDRIKASGMSKSAVSSPPVTQAVPHVFTIPKVPPKPVGTDQNRQSAVIPPSPYINEEEFKDPRLQNGLLPAMKKATPMPYDCRNILSDVLNWNVDWIGAADPPIVGDVTTLSRVPSTFHSYGHYVNTIVPLLKLGLFQAIVDAYPHRIMKSTIKAELITQNKHKLQNFKCQSLVSIQCDISSRDHRQQFNHIRQGTLVIITHSTPCTNNPDEQCFGYVTRVSDLSRNMTNHNQRKSNLSILVSHKSPIAQLNNKIIFICFLEYVKVELETFVSLAEFKYFPLKQMILNPKEIDHDHTITAPTNKNARNFGMERLNQDQYQAMSLVSRKIELECDKPHVFIIEGPPGTGKTRLIANTILHIIRNPNTTNKEFRILLSAPSNNAVDLLTEKLIGFRGKLKDEERKNLRLVRFGDNMSSNVEMFGLRSLLMAQVEREFTRVANTFPENSNEQKERHVILNTIRMLNKSLSGSNISPTQCHENKNQLFTLKKDLQRVEEKMYFMKQTPKELDHFKSRTRRDLVNRANIVSCTLTSCPSLWNSSEGKYDIAIIDEATQATESASLMALNFGVKHLVMIGDTQQLPAMIRNPDAKELGLGQSFFARAASVISSHLSLRTQYRMHSEIFKFSNEYFYSNRIMNGTKIDDTNQYKLKPYLVFELESEQNFTQNPHCYNTEEIDFVSNLVKTIKVLIHPVEYSIGVVTPYAKQKQLIEAKLGSDKSIAVFTIDAIQGQEKDIIVFSCVRTDGVGFMSVPERLNVALTRARKSLFICGNFMSLKHVDVWDRLIQDAQQRNVFVDTSVVDISNLQKHLLDVQ